MNEELNLTEKETLEWVQLKNEIRSDVNKVPVETIKERTWRKIIENPFVPIGALATVGCLVMGLRSFLQGDSMKSQYMMRARVAAQGFTVVAIIGGIALEAKKKKPGIEH